MSDPRDAKTLGEAALNQDGTYNGARALSWLSSVLSKGEGVSEQEVKDIWKKAKQDHEKVNQ